MRTRTDPDPAREAPAPAALSTASPPEPEGARPLLARLGHRIRERRRDRALTMRELAERAGLSERFLVSMEAGRANVSVIRLDDVARALETSAAALLSDPSPPDDVRAAAGPSVALLGLRGAGKTTLGGRAAARLGLPFVELDERVAEAAGLPLDQVFELLGLDHYRRLVRQALDEVLAEGRRVIVATGGSLVTDHAAFARLRRGTRTVWLKARAEDHWTRVVGQGDARPMADRVDARTELKALLRARRALYEQADHVIDTSKLGPDRATAALVKIVRDAAAPATRRPNVRARGALE